MNKISEFELSLNTFNNQYPNSRSKNVFVLDEINEVCLEGHKKNGFRLEINEKPLLVLNGKKGLIGFFLPTTSLIITDKKIFFRTLKRSVFTSLWPHAFLQNPQNLNLESIDSFQIGQHDSCLGYNYVGHDLMVNNQAVGLVRMGHSIMLDDKAISYINSLSKYLYTNGFLKSDPIEYAWQ